MSKQGPESSENIWEVSAECARFYLKGSVLKEISSTTRTIERVSRNSRNLEGHVRIWIGDSSAPVLVKNRSGKSNNSAVVPPSE